MTDDRAAKLIALVEHLETAPQADWDEVESLVADFPGWLNLVQHLRYHAPTDYTRVIRMGAPEQYMAISDEKRRQLLGIFRPYAILLNAEMTPAQKAARLQQEADVRNVRKFCAEALHVGSPEIAQAAEAIRAACDADAMLLRGASSPQQAPDELLRVASDTNPASEGLLRAADTAAPSEPHRPGPGPLQRFLRRFRRPE